MVPVEYIGAQVRHMSTFPFFVNLFNLFLVCHLFLNQKQSWVYNLKTILKTTENCELQMTNFMICLSHHFLKTLTRLH